MANLKPQFITTRAHLDTVPDDFRVGARASRPQHGREACEPRLHPSARITRCGLAVRAPGAVRGWTALAAGALLFALSAFAQPHQLVENFSAPLPSNAQVVNEADFTNAKVGLAAGKLTYHINPRTRVATLDLGDERRAFAGPGLLKLWIKGNNSTNELELVLRHGKPQVANDGRRWFAGQNDFALPRVKLDFDGWREVTLDARTIPEGNAGWWQRLAVHAPGKSENFDGTLWLDDLRHFPDANPPAAASVAGLIGPSVREFGTNVALFLDVRNFTAKPAKIRARLTLTDRNESAAADREFQVELAAQESKEIRLELAPDNLAAFLPPFKLAGDVLSTDLQDLTARVDTTLVMGNSRYLFDDFSDVFSHWFNIGTPTSPRANQRTWVDWTHGEAQRATPLTQTSARLGRGDIAPGTNAPPGRYALRLDYDADAVIYTGRQRYLPGNAYRVGLWVKGDGSNSRLFALFLDYTHGADFYSGGWKRIYDGEREVTTLDFTDWRYIEVELPGKGIGSNTPNGSTANLDFPLELTALRIQTGPASTNNPATNGPVFFGPIHAFTQLALSGALAVHVGYDDANHQYQPALGAHVTVQNSALPAARKVKANWSLLDRASQPIAAGQVDLDLPPGEAKSFRLDLAKHAADIATKAAPFRLQVTAYDAADGSVSTTRQIVLTRPDSRAVVADFEADRGFLGLKAREIKNAPPEGQSAARTSTEQAHGGKRSLLIEWDKEKAAQRYIAIDPALPGVPVELTLWLHGDNSGVLFYPLIGDRKGINHGLPNGQWNLFLPRVIAGSSRREEAPSENPQPGQSLLTSAPTGLQNAVRVDWTGWRELKFRLPPVAPNWAEANPTLGFVPNYPLGIHLAVDTTSTTNTAGKLFVDDLVVTTHLPPEARVELTYDRPGESNFQPPGTPVQVTLANHDLTAPRRVTLSGGLFDWRGTRVAGMDTELELAPGSRRAVELAKNFPAGFYLLKATLTDIGARAALPVRTDASAKEPPRAGTAARAPERDGRHILAELEEDILVADPVATLGTNWVPAVTDEWQLRKPIQDRFTFVDEDWDWVEHHPGNLQLDTIRARARRVSEAGGEPFMLLGYAAFWAAGAGYDALSAGAFQRLHRHRGQAVNTFLIPKRLADWDNYVCELMRGAGREVGGWVVWDSPDSIGPMSFPAEKFAPFLRAADKWRRVYCPEKPLLIGGLARNTAVPYLKELAQHGGLDAVTGVNVRLDVGRLSPEDAGVVGYIRELRAALNPVPTNAPKSILLTDLDWAVEKGTTGLNAFDQAAYLARSALLLDRAGIRPALSVRNEDFVRLGLGLTYRRELSIPPLQEKPLAYQFKPAWWAMARVRQWLGASLIAAEIEVQDIVPGGTRCLLQQDQAGRPVAFVWRNDDAGQLSFAQAGLTVAAAEDLFGAAVPVTNGWFAIGKVPCRFTLTASAEPVVSALARLRVRDGAEPLWPQRVLAAFTPAAGKPHDYAHTGGELATLAGRTAAGETLEWPGLRFAAEGSERFRVDAPVGASLVLRKQFLLDATGQEAEVFVNGKSAGKWNLRRSEQELSGGLREAIFIVDQAALAGQPQAQIEIRYRTAANTAGWRVFEWRDGVFPLSAVGALHADQNVAAPRFARNIVGASLKVGTESFANGIGTFARSLLEFPLNGQFRRFTAKAGVDAVTEGRGSVVFEIYGDGKKLWNSPTLSGLDAPKEIDLDLTGVDRLRLVVTDAGDGNKFDVADWLEPVLRR